MKTKAKPLSKKAMKKTKGGATATLLQAGETHEQIAEKEISLTIARSDGGGARGKIF